MALKTSESVGVSWSFLEYWTQAWNELIKRYYFNLIDLQKCAALMYTPFTLREDPTGVLWKAMITGHGWSPKTNIDDVSVLFEETRILFTISLISVTYCTPCLIKKYIKLCLSCWRFYLKNMLISIRSFIIPWKDTIHAPGLRFLWKKEIFGKNCSSLGKVMRTVHFTFTSSISMLLSLHLQNGCGKEPLIRFLIIFFVFY